MQPHCDCETVAASAYVPQPQPDVRYEDEPQPQSDVRYEDEPQPQSDVRYEDEPQPQFDDAVA